MLPNFYIIQCALIAGIGGAMYGIDGGVIATSIAHASFTEYMLGQKNSAALLGAIVSLYPTGQAIGAFAVSPIADKFSRKRAISLSALLACVGTTIQTASVNVGMMIAGRLIAGLASGMVLTVVPIYIGELAPPKWRASVVGLLSFMVAMGFCVANWIGYAGGYAHGNAQWRIPLGCQIPCTVLLFLGSLIIPYTPRWLIQQGRHDEAKAVLQRVHRGMGDHFIAQEFQQIHDQILYEQEENKPGIVEATKYLFSRKYIFRTALATFCMSHGYLSGSGVIQNYQSKMYAVVGFTGSKSLLISGIYGFMGVIGQVINLAGIADRIGRRLTLMLGGGALTVFLSVLCALSAVYSKPDANQNGARAAIALIFLYSATYAVFLNSTTIIVPSELFPFFLRSQGLGFAFFTKSVIGIALTQATPTALANIKYWYYLLFIAINFGSVFVYFFFLPETNGKTLEEIGEIFGDILATEQLEEIQVRKDGAEGEHVEKTLSNDEKA